MYYEYVVTKALRFRLTRSESYYYISYLTQLQKLLAATATIDSQRNAFQFQLCLPACLHARQ